MAIQVLGGGMNDKMKPVLQRPLHPGAGQGVVGDGDQAVGAGDGGHRREVDQFEQRIGRGLDRRGSRRLIDHYRHRGWGLIWRLSINGATAPGFLK